MSGNGDENTGSMNSQQAYEMQKALGEAVEKRPLRYNGPAYSHPCGHLSPGGPDICPTCAEIKAAREEMLKMVTVRVFDYKGVDDETSAMIMEHILKGAV